MLNLFYRLPGADKVIGWFVKHVIFWRIFSMLSTVQIPSRADRDAMIELMEQHVFFLVLGRLLQSSDSNVPELTLCLSGF
jgi:hypothetical protein